MAGNTDQPTSTQLGIADRLSSLLVSRFGINADELVPEVTFSELDLDSLTLVEFLLVVDKEFGVELPSDAVSPDDTVTRVAELLEAETAIAADPA